MATKTRSRFESLDDILAALDRIPARRIRTHPAPGTATEADWLKLHDASDRLYELIEGTLVEKPMGAGESYLATEIIFWLRTYLQQNNLGAVLGADGGMRLMPDLIRIPDVSFIRWERFPEPGKVPVVPVLDLAPDLAVEIISPSNRRGELQRKLRDYFNAQVHSVWFVDPATRTVRVYPDGNTFQLFSGTDVVADALLPGFELPLATLFANLASPERASAPGKKRKKR